jgi:glycerophosphoryl diester phosphodiesterase
MLLLFAMRRVLGKLCLALLAFNSMQNLAAAAHAKILVVPWTADTPEEWDPLIAAKVDAIITDDPAALIAYLKKRGLN